MASPLVVDPVMVAKSGIVSCEKTLYRRS